MDSAIWILLIIVIGAMIIAWIGAGCPAPKVVDHHHYHHYKLSTDYEHLWDLIVNQGMHIVIDHGSGPFRFSEGQRGDHYLKDIIYGIDGKIYVSDGMEKFINFCRWKEIKFFDPVDEVKIPDIQFNPKEN